MDPGQQVPTSCQNHEDRPVARSTHLPWKEEMEPGPLLSIRSQVLAVNHQLMYQIQISDHGK